MIRVLNGAELAGFIKERQAKQVRNLRQTWQVFPRLAIVTDSDNPVIATYMRLKEHYGADILIDVEIHRVSSSEIRGVIAQLNARHDVHGIIVQLPLADESQTEEVLTTVALEKDVDGLRQESMFDAATPIAINWLLAGYNVELAGKKVAIVGRGRLVGAPLERMWQASNIDVAMFEKGDELLGLTKYDVIVTATGVPGLIGPEMVQPGAIIVDAGTSSEHGKIVGDVNPAVRERLDVSITPEKGGVGPLTVAALFDNVILAARQIAKQQEGDA